MSEEYILKNNMISNVFVYQMILIHFKVMATNLLLTWKTLHREISKVKSNIWSEKYNLHLLFSYGIKIFKEKVPLSFLLVISWQGWGVGNPNFKKLQTAISLKKKVNELNRVCVCVKIYQF